MAEEPRHDDGTPLPEIAGYRLLREINHGGMSTVYLARQHTLGRDVAIKVMSPQALSDEVSRRRFERQLEHYHGNMRRAAVELAREWRGDRRNDPQAAKHNYALASWSSLRPHHQRHEPQRALVRSLH